MRSSSMAVAVSMLCACGRLGFESGDRPVVDGARDGVVDGAASRYASAVLADTPLAYWRLGGTDPSMVADHTGNAHHGVATTGASLGADGLLAGDPDLAIAFDGATGFIVVSDHPMLRLTSQLTLEAWINASAFDNAAGVPYQRIVHKGSIGNTGYALMAFQIGTTNTANLRVELEGLTAAGVTGTTVLVPNTTYHVATTWDGSSMRVFVDGALDGSVAATGSIPATTDTLEIGRRPDGQRYWAGRIDEVAVYGVALDAARIAAHYNAGK